VHQPGRPVHSDYFVLGSHVEVQRGAHMFRGYQQQTLAIGDGPADMVGQPAVRVGNVPITFQHNDARMFIEPSQARRGGHAGGHAADNHNLLQDRVPFLVYCRRSFRFTVPSNRSIALVLVQFQATCWGIGVTPTRPDAPRPIRNPKSAI
jgi:hypothetical protein